MRRARRLSPATLLGLVLTAATIAWVAHLLDWAAARASLAGARPGWLALGLAAFALNYGLRTLRFRALGGARTVPLARLLAVTSLHGMFNYLLPAKSGEVAYVVLARRHLDVPFAEGTATLVGARFFDFAIVALALPAVLSAFYRELPGWLIASSIGYCVLVLAAAVALVAWLRRVDTDRLELDRGPPAVARLGRAFARTVAALKAIVERRRYARLWLLSAGIWLCVYANFYCIVRAVGFSPSFVEMVVVSIVLVPLTLLPVQGLANVGSHEIGWVLALSLFGHPLDDALTIAVATHVVLLCFVLLLGALGFVLLAR